MSNAISQSLPFARQSSQQRRSPGFILFQRQRQYFITRVYLLAIVFVGLTVLQWISILSNPEVVDFFRDKYYISLMSGVSALLLFTSFAIVFEIRYMEPYNWIVAYLIVELETLALVRAPLDSDLKNFGICFLATILINGVFRFIGVLIPWDLTQEIITLMVVSLIFYVAASIILILLILTELYYLRLFLLIGTIILLIVVSC
ncbi:uncharacterized protein LOC129907282 [Episyrphus balteatus]|uniref:uncharacterized protein LOC129907282 n=1 Tax=Episyrphus balteatus TaxID=286459 RepID=UPI002485AD3B|nr:uncharacterized protein LOC129907282 [Episyrphus balteatus]